ncbi:nucleotidyltransferase domain-containing protein [Methylomonas albis]|uniref:Nucleotidyltransferase domain-containing protein n=1 Tax=Methylomonas albis TaxID=1854563 RepID=A0ABR9CVG7_9GAMM|nr:nucleotidyltransferase domain-containing protein [Methylomonas albis]MBD9354837.1 nucleotidyltransferase domain-containing protein [Methylomonas albis]
MRLSQSQAQTIRESVLSDFGEDAHVWLFGSRVRDEEKGGYIDLYIEVQALSAADLITSKLTFLRDLHKRLGDQKIDVVLRKADGSVELPIYQIAKQTGIQWQ